MSAEKSTAGGFFRGLWKVINGTRLVFLNLLFFGFLLLLIAALFRPEDEVSIEGQTTLILRPYGVVVEEYTSSPLDRALLEAMDQEQAETRLRDLLRAVERATDDPRITQMLIDTDYLLGVGLSSLRELERVVLEFKAAGKPVVAIGDIMGREQYYLAALADEVWLNPDGVVWLEGYANVRQYYKDALDKLEVEVNLFRVGEYKSAMEPFIRNDMSEEAREAALFWLGSLWQHYLEAVSRHRGIPLEALDSRLAGMPESLEAVGGDFALQALEMGLVDRLVTRPEARQELALRGAPDADSVGFRSVETGDYLRAITLPQALKPKSDIRVLVAEGAIVGGRPGLGSIGSEDLRDSLRELASDETVRAVVFRVNSPGGDALASEKIRTELQALRDAGKTVVVSMGDVAASGGYWISMSSDELWASPATITGSIGVFGFLPTFGATLGNLGIHSDGVGTTELAGKLRLDRPLDERLGRIFQASVEHTYAQFLELVAGARGLSVEQVDEVARGRVWSGAQAAERGLVDRVGTLQEATAAAARIAGLGEDYTVDYYRPQLSPLEQFFEEVSLAAVRHLPASALPGGLLGSFQGSGVWLRSPLLQGLWEDLGLIARADGRLTIAAHCLCRAP